MAKKDTSINYYKGFQARKNDLSNNHDKSSVSFKCYCAGLAVECLLRAYITKHVKEFDCRHDLRRLSDKAVSLNRDLAGQREELSFLVDQLNRLWKNNLRYMSDFEYYQYLVNKFKTKNKIKAKVLNEKLNDILSISKMLFNIGEDLWKQ